MQPLQSATNRRAADPHACSAALLDALPGVMWFVRRHMRSRRAAGLSVPQFRVLAHLYRSSNGTVSILAEKLGITLPSVSRLVTGLVGKGYIVRRHSPDDRREIVLSL